MASPDPKPHLRVVREAGARVPESELDERGRAAIESGRWDGIERRSGVDRREGQMGARDLFRLVPRRSRPGGRRSSDPTEGYVDSYTRRDVAMLMAIFLLNIADAFFTLHWLERGGAEGNPLMQRLLDIGTEVFLFQKIAVAGFWGLILIAHKNFRLARIGMRCVLGVYALLLGYHLVLFFFGEPLPPPLPPGAEGVPAAAS